MKYKIVAEREYDAITDPKNCEAITKYEITIQSPIGRFTGISTLYAEDIPKKSKWLGYEIAEQKAVRKMYKKYIANVKIELKVYEDLSDRRYDDDYIHSQIQTLTQKIKNAELQLEIVDLNIVGALKAHNIWTKS